jgi:hypothetical protein
MNTTIRNRIKAHRRVRAGDLLPHELNFRLHPEMQRNALWAVYQEVGFARSLLAYELPDGRLKLIDGHLRRDIDPDMEVEVEILDLTDEEAKVLLLSIDPLAALAENQEQIHNRLLELAPRVSVDLQAAWDAAANATLGRRPYEPKKEGVKKGGEQWLVLVTCEDEKHQVAVLEKLQGEGLSCRALIA